MPSRKSSAESRKEEARRKAREKSRAFRERMRARGLRPVQIWLPDTRSDEFARRAHEASLAVSGCAYAKDDQDFVDSVSGDLFE